MNHSKITSRQLGILAFFLMKSCFLLFAIPYLFSLAQNDVLIAIPIGTILGLIPLFVYISIQTKTPKGNIFEKIKANFSKPIALLFQIFIFVGLLFLSCFLTYHIVTYINYSLVPKISLLVITITFILLVYQLAMKGIETICRTGEILIYLFFILFAISLLGLGSYIDLKNIYPFLHTAPNSILKASLCYAGFLTGPLFLILLVLKKNMTDTKNYSKCLIKSYFLTSFIIWIFFFITISILGIELTLTYQYPTTIILKKVVFLKIIERLEAVLAIHFLCDLFLLLSTIFITLKEGLKTCFCLQNEKKIKIAMILISIFVLLGSNYIPHQDMYYIIIFIIIAFVIPLILFLKQLFTKKR